MSMNPEELKGALEAIIYAADEPATLEQIAGAVGEDVGASGETSWQEGRVNGGGGRDQQD